MTQQPSKPSRRKQDIRDLDNESWVINAGYSVIRKKVDHGQEDLTPLESLINCLWVADYGMRNAGDLETAHDVYEPFQEEAARFAQELGLAFTQESFGLPTKELERQYFDRFDRICNEIRSQSHPVDMR